MHYKNGREAKLGDSVIGKDYQTHFAGTLFSITPGCQSCNGRVAVPIVGGSENKTVTIGELIHAEDAYRVFTLPVPASTTNPERTPEAFATVKTDGTAAPVPVTQ